MGYAIHASGCERHGDALHAGAGRRMGDRVKIRGRERFGVGTVISFDADYRLVRLSFSGMDGWWARMDLMKEGEND